MNFEISINDRRISSELLDKTEYTVDQLSIDTFNVRIGKRNFSCTIASHNSTKDVVVNVNGQDYRIEIEDELDLLLSKMGLNKESEVSASDVFSPMPGLVIDCHVKVGSEVEKDQQLLVLEAMKMENIIKARGSGIVEEIHIEKGGKVEKAQLLISIKPRS